MRAFHEVRNYSTDFMVWHKEYTNISFMAHWHREIELLYIKRGAIKMQVTSHSFTANEGDLIICDSGDIHYSNSHSKDSVLDFIIFDTGLISKHYSYQHFSKPLLTSEELREAGLDQLLLSLEQVIDEELSQQQEHYREVITAALQNFWFRLLRVMPVTPLQERSQNRRLSMLSDFQKLLSYMEEHSSEIITLEAAADMMHFSPSHFSKVFTQVTGIGFVKYLNAIRITQASELLIHSDYSITQIAYRCGFQNLRTFHRVFKQITGVTPMEYISIPENHSRNFTYYKSNSNILSLAEKDPETIIPSE